MRLATYHVAKALADDLQHIRKLLNEPKPTPGDIRRLSAWLRRILVEGDLNKAAAPRVGRIQIDAQDLKAFWNTKWEILLVNAADVFGITTSTVVAARTPVPIPQPPYPSIKLTLDTFLSQKVICFQGEWATRRDAIKFVANKAQGIHTTDVQSSVEKMLLNIRHMIVTHVNGEDTVTTTNLYRPSDPEGPFKAGKFEIDSVQMNLVATAKVLVDSEEVRALEEIIEGEE
jgi:hypothetical protein